MTEPDVETAELYARLAPNLRRIVTHNFNAPRDLIEDACQLAWSALLADPSAVTSGNHLAWLSVTASRALLRLLRVRAREVSLELFDQDSGAWKVFEDRRGGERLLELHESLLDLERLPDRERRMLWLRALGYDYEEMAAQTGESVRTVERLLRSGREHARELAS